MIEDIKLLCVRMCTKTTMFMELYILQVLIYYDVERLISLTGLLTGNMF